MNTCLAESDSGVFGRRLWLLKSWRIEDGLRQRGTLNNKSGFLSDDWISLMHAPVCARNVSGFLSQDGVRCNMLCQILQFDASSSCQLHSVNLFSSWMLLSESAASWIGTFSGQMSDGCMSSSIISTSQSIRWASNFVPGDLITHSRGALILLFEFLNPTWLIKAFLIFAHCLPAYVEYRYQRFNHFRNYYEVLFCLLWRILLFSF